MSQFLILATCGLLNQSEAARDDAETLARQRISAMRTEAESLRTVEGDKSTISARVKSWVGPLRQRWFCL